MLQPAGRILLAMSTKWTEGARPTDRNAACLTRADLVEEATAEEGEEERVLASAKLSGAPEPRSLSYKLHVVDVPGLSQAVRA